MWINEDGGNGRPHCGGRRHGLGPGLRPARQRVLGRPGGTEECAARPATSRAPRASSAPNAATLVRKRPSPSSPRPQKKFDINPSLLGIEKSDFVIGMVARGIPEKGWNELMEMFLILKKTYVKRKLHLILIGNGDYLKQIFQSKKVENMHLLQFTKNPMEYFSWIARFNMGILLSYFKGESVPNAVIEYLYHGLPVLATSMGDINKMISSPEGMAGETIFLKDGKADINLAADIIKKWLDDAEYFNHLKQNTKSAFEKFRMENIAEEYLSVYSEAISNFQKSSTYSE